MTTTEIMNALEAAGSGKADTKLTALLRGLLDGDDSGKMHEEAAKWLASSLH